MVGKGKTTSRGWRVCGQEGMRGSHYVFTEFGLFARSDDENCQVFSLAWDKCPRVAMHTRNAFDCWRVKWVEPS